MERAPRRDDGGPRAPHATRRRARAALRSPCWSLALLAGCACTSLPEIDLNPLLRVEHTADGAVEIEALGPLVDVRVGPEGTSHAVRPIYQHRIFPDQTRTDVLPPLGCRQVTRTGTAWRAIPLVWSARHRVDGPHGPEWDAIAFPIVLMGGGPRDGDGYFAFFPVAGRTRQLFGVQTFDFVLWPLFMRMHMDVTEPSTSWSILLLFGWTDGGLRDGSWRALPFWRQLRWRTPEGGPRAAIDTALWPFFTWGRRQLDTDDPSHRLALWPLVSWESADRWFKSTWLWPFFRVNRGSFEHGDEHLYDLPWPFFRTARGSAGTQFRLWPLYMRETTATKDARHYLWPIARDRRWDPLADGGWNRRDVDVIPLWHSSRRGVDLDDGGRAADVEWQAWPLAHSTRRVPGIEDRGALSLLPFRHVDFLRPMDDLYSFAWTLWRRRELGPVRETRWLFDTAFHRTAPEGVRVSIPLLYARRPEGPEVARHQVLWGLVTWRTGAADLRSLSVLGVPLWRR